MRPHVSIPVLQMAYVGAYVFRQHLARRKRYPLVLMLEPLFRCNLACAGCGKIDYPDEILNQRLSVAECLEAVDECGAPIVSIPGGEPLLHKEIGEIVEGIVERKRFTDLVGPDTKDICYATQNRQTAVRQLSKLADVILVVGASNSSNSNRLREIGREEGVPSYLIGSGAELDPAWVEGARVVGITAGASAPEALVEDLVETLRRTAPVEVSVLPGIVEDVKFRLPSELLDA